MQSLLVTVFAVPWTTIEEKDVNKKKVKERSEKKRKLLV